jgi:hypothetical protein
VEFKSGLAGKRFLEALTTRELLPHLCSLTIRELFPDHTQYKQLVRTLAARGSCMRSFKLLWKGKPSRVPETNIIAALRGIAMDIHVGTSGHNLV